MDERAATPILATEGLSKHFGGLRATHDVSLSLHRNQLHAVIGPNGAGKSTLLKVITGLLRPRNGRVLFKGREIQSLPAHQMVGQGMAMSPEGRQVFPKMTVRENLEMGAYVRSQFPQEQLDWVLDLFPKMKQRLDQRAGTLSGGEQQMLAIGRALMSQPELLILDEPSLGLAPMIVAQIFDIVGQIHQRGVSVLLVEQNAYQALKVAQRGYVLETGHILMHASAQELANDPKVREAYLGLPSH